MMKLEPIVPSTDRVSAVRDRNALLEDRICHECSFAIFSDDIFCGGCGKLIKRVYKYNDNGIGGPVCQWCGNRWIESANYCTKCGNPRKN